MTACTTPEAALAFVREHGVVLVSAKGNAPRLTEAIVGEPVKGSWWGHPQGRLIFHILEALTASDEILVCRLIKGKLTLVHRRLWPALARLAGRLQSEQIAQVREQHTPAGRHVTTAVAFPEWVPAMVLEQAKAMSEQEALTALGAWL